MSLLRTSAKRQASEQEVLSLALQVYLGPPSWNSAEMQIIETAHIYTQLWYLDTFNTHADQTSHREIP